MHMPTHMLAVCLSTSCMIFYWPKAQRIQAAQSMHVRPPSNQQCLNDSSLTTKADEPFGPLPEICASHQLLMTILRPCGINLTRQLHPNVQQHMQHFTGTTLRSIPHDDEVEYSNSTTGSPLLAAKYKAALCPNPCCSTPLHPHHGPQVPLPVPL